MSDIDAVLQNFIAEVRKEETRYRLKVAVLIDRDPTRAYPLNIVTDEISFYEGKNEGISLVLKMLEELRGRGPLY